MKENEYKCANCNNIYKKGWSDEEAVKEATGIFGKPPSEWKDEQVIICDDCFTLMYPPMHPELLKEAKLRL